MPGNNYPKLHNAMWPGLVGKGPDSEPPIDLDTMLKLTAAARFDGEKFEGVDLFLADPHTSIDSLAICFWFSAGLDAQSCTPAAESIRTTPDLRMPMSLSCRAMRQAFSTIETNLSRSSCEPIAEPPPTGGQTGATTEPTASP